MKRGQDWFQKLLQILIIGMGLYIIYRGSGILAETGWIRHIMQADVTVKTMQDSALDTYLPGYLLALEQAENTVRNDTWLEHWLEPFLPVLQELRKEAYRESEKAGLREQVEETEVQEDRAEKGKTLGQTEKTVQSEPTGQSEQVEEKKTDETGKRSDGKEGSEKNEQSEPAGQREQAEETGQSEQMEQMEQAEETGQSEQTGQTEAMEQETDVAEEAVAQPLDAMPQLEDFDYLLNHYFIVDSDTTTDATQLDARSLLEEDLSIQKDPKVPQILIYHTHSQEAFLDSRDGAVEDTIVGMGDYLAGLLENTYSYQVIHDTGVYDLVDGVLDRSAAYDYARAAIEPLLEEYPSIEVIIDLHRDGVEGKHFVTDINGKQTAQIMFFNGLSRDSNGQSISYLYNPYVQDNLAFSLQLQLAAERSYPAFTRNIYLKGQRFNLHLRPRSLLIEAGTQLNTVEEERNAMEPLADILNQVLDNE